MADDQVRIDPQFSPPPPSDGPGRRVRIVAIVAVAIAAFAYGWLLRSPSSGESEQEEVAVTTSTALPAETVAASTTTRPSTTTTTEPLAVVGLQVPLGEAVPGFTDTITMAVWSDPGMDVMRWKPSEPEAETIASFRSDELGFFAGLDASGSWYAVKDDSGVLRVRPLLGLGSSGTAVDVDEPWAWSSTFREAVAVRVTTEAWHETEPGRLAWLTCWGTPGGPGTLYTLDVAEGAAEPRPVRSIERVCPEDSGAWLGGWGAGAWLEGWGGWGFALVRWEDERVEFVLLDGDGIEVASIADDSGNIGLWAGPGGAIMRTGLPGVSGSSSLLSVDGRRHDRVPGLSHDQWVDDALWSPDGSMLALSLRRSLTDVPTMRVVEMATGAEIVEIAESEREVWPIAWSKDGRLLFLERSAGDFYEESAGNGVGEPPMELVVYDTETNLAHSIPLPEGWFVEEIRTSELALPAEQLTPVQWGITIDDAGSGVHSVDMIVDARPLTPDQVEDVSGRLVWDETVVDLCHMDIREVGAGFVHVGDIFGTGEGCGTDPTAMQDAFDAFGVPETACVSVGVAGLDHEYCAPLS